MNDQIKDHPGTHDPPDTEALRRAFRQRPISSDPTELPSPARLWDALSGELKPHQRRELIEQTAASPELAEEWRLAQALQDEIRAADERAPVSHPAFTRASPRPWQLALAALLLAAVGLWLLSDWQTEPGPASGGEPIVRNSGGKKLSSLLPADALLSRQAPVLRWQGLEGARYDLRVSNLELVLLAEGRDFAEPRFELPAELFDQLPAGSEILWQVEAILPSGERLISETFVQRLQ